MIASVQIGDVGPRNAASMLLRSRRLRGIAGLRHCDVGLAAPLSGSTTTSPQFGRAALIGFWDDDGSFDRFLADHPVARALAGGWEVRLAPLRMFGTWPGVPDDIPGARVVDHDGPAVVLTMGRLRLSQARRFLRTSARAAAAVLDAPGLMWASGLARPPFVATCSVWESSRALSTYAYGHSQPAHPEAIDTDAAKPSITSLRSSVSDRTPPEAHSKGGTPWPKERWRFPRRRRRAGPL